MAVMIRGMDMPENCADCRFAVWRPQHDGSSVVQCQALLEGDDDEIDWRGEGRMKRLDNCPLEDAE